MNPLSQLPSVDRLLTATALVALAGLHGRPVVMAPQRDGAPPPDEATLIARVGAVYA